MKTAMMKLAVARRTMAAISMIMIVTAATAKPAGGAVVKGGSGACSCSGGRGSSNERVVMA